MRARILMSALLSLTAACGDGTELLVEPVQGPGEYLRSFRLDGHNRAFVLVVPDTVDLGAPAPLLLVLHAVPSDPVEMRELTGFDDVATAAGFVVAYLSVDPRPQDWNHSCRDCSLAAALDVDDIAYTEAVLDKLHGDMSIDPARTYVTGFSQGGLMAFRIACELSDRFAGAATVSASLLDWQAERCAPARTMPFLLIHGTEDPLVPWEGLTAGAVSALSVPATVEHWVTIDGCGTTPASVALPDAVADGTTVTRHTYSGCTAGSEVVLYEVEGGGHTWPFSPSDLGVGEGVESQEVDASAVIADFLLRFRR